MIVTAADIDTLARTIYGEARGEYLRGQIAVAWTIVNRARADLGGDCKPDWWGEGIAGVCLAPWQYSCWNAGDPNRARLEAVTPADPQFRRCLGVAAMVLAAADGAAGAEWEDPTQGSTHYLNPAALKSLPAWAANRQHVVAIGRHIFFNDVER